MWAKKQTNYVNEGVHSLECSGIIAALYYIHHVLTVFIMCQYRGGWTRSRASTNLAVKNAINRAKCRTQWKRRVIQCNTVMCKIQVYNWYTCSVYTRSMQMKYNTVIHNLCFTHLWISLLYPLLQLYIVCTLLSLFCYVIHSTNTVILCFLYMR